MGGGGGLVIAISQNKQVTVCGSEGGEKEGAWRGRSFCESPSLAGSGQSLFVAQLEDIPEIAEAGGARVPASVLLEPKR